MNLHTIAILPGFLLFEIPRMVVSTCSAAIVLFLIGIFAVKNEFAQERGLDKIVALANLCFAIPLAVFGAEHFAAAQGISTMVPKFVPWHLFWAYFVGVAFVASALSISSQMKARLSATWLGIMFLLWVLVLHLPRVVGAPHNGDEWTSAFVALAMSGGAFLVAGSSKKN